KGRIKLALGKGLALKSALALTAPMLLQPDAHLLAERICCVSEVIARQAALLAIEQPCSYLTAGLMHPAERERIEVHAPEVPRRLMVLGIADRTEGVMGLERYLTQRRVAE